MGVAIQCLIQPEILPGRPGLTGEIVQGSRLETKTNKQKHIKTNNNNNNKTQVNEMIPNGMLLYLVPSPVVIREVLSATDGNRCRDQYQNTRKKGA